MSDCMVAIFSSSEAAMSGHSGLLFRSDSSEGTVENLVERSSARALVASIFSMSSLLRVEAWIAGIEWLGVPSLPGEINWPGKRPC